MTKTISSREAIDAINLLLSGHDDVSDVTIIERDGDPIAVVISMETYRQLVDTQARCDWEIIATLRERNRHKDAAQLERDRAETIEEVRADRRSARQQTA